MTRGEQFAERVREDFELSLGEELILDEIVRCMDVIDRGGLSDAELRQWVTLVSRLLYQLNLPEPGTGDRQEQTSRKASRAARARWGREAI